MTAYDNNIQATEMTPLPEFFDIYYGTTHERYTSYSEDTDFGFYTWTAAPIKRTSFNRDNDFATLQTTISTYPSPLLRLYVAAQPVEPVYITIYRALTADLTSYATIFSGVVKSVQFAEGQVSALCVASAQYLKKKIPPYLYQAFCNHTLYDTGCGLDKAAWKITGILTVVSGTRLAATIWTTKPDGWFNGGYVEIGGDKRLIIKHIGANFTIHAPFDNRATPGASADAYPGCDKNPATCKAKFSNFDAHFLGMPYIPTRNPVIQGFK